MRRFRWAIAWVWFLVALPAFGQEAELTLDEVIRLHAAGTTEDALVERIALAPNPVALDEGAIGRIKRANLPTRVMVALMKSGRKKPARPGSGFTTGGPAEVPAGEGGAPLAPDEPARSPGRTGAPEPDVAVPGFTQFRHAEGRFAIQFPAGWKVVTTRNGRSTLRKEAFELAFVPADEIDDLARLRAFFIVTFLPRKPDSPQPSLEDWLKAYKQRLQMLEPGYALSGDEVVTLGGGTQAARLAAEGTSRDGGTIKVVFYGVIEQDGFFLLRHGAPVERYGEFEPAFTAMAPTFQLRPSAALGAAESQPENGQPDLLAARSRPFNYGSAEATGKAGGPDPGGARTEGTPGRDEGVAGGGAGSTDPDRGATGIGGAGKPGPGTLPVLPPTPAVEEPQASFVEYAEPDGRFRVQFPAGWKRADVATAAGVAYYFSPKPYQPHEGKPFTGGVCVTVQSNVYADPGASEEMAKLASTGEAVRRQFVESQEAARSLVRVHDPALLELGGGHPALVYRYTLTYPNGGDELGFMVVAVHGAWVVVAEGNAPRESYHEVQGTLLQVVESLTLVE